jgi:ribA/ribD-fused uncharacterized protein
MTTRRAILSTTKPGAAKALGRTIAGFDEVKWQATRFQTVVVGNLLKFSGDGALKEYLLETGDKVLVEASPVDRIWGIGLAADNPSAERPEDWQGLNLLGFALMCARDMRAQVDIREGADHVAMLCVCGDRVDAGFGDGAAAAGLAFNREAALGRLGNSRLHLSLGKPLADPVPS